jgi:ABC-type nitrate/sulfonate/bicarbonate transport system permease component
MLTIDVLKLPDKLEKMSVSLIATVTGFIVGCSAAGAIGLCMLFSRPYRKENSRFANHMAQILCVASICGSLLVIQMLDVRLGVEHHSPSYYAVRAAYLIAFISVVFFVLRADLRWQKLAGMGKQTN